LISSKRIQTSERTSNDAQAVAIDTARALNDSVTVRASLLSEENGAPSGTGLVFSAGQTRTIRHLLRTSAVGWTEVSSSKWPGLRVELYPAAHPPGATDATHVTVTATNAGRCALLVY
jgi:hypothetical protein